MENDNFFRKDYFISLLKGEVVITKNAEMRLHSYEDLIDPKKRYLYRVGDKVLTPFGIQTIKHIDHNYGSLTERHGYEWLITVEENENQYNPCELIGIVVPLTLKHFGLRTELKQLLRNQ